MRTKIKGVEIVVEELLIISLLTTLFSSTCREFFSNYFTCYLFIAFHELSHILVASICGVVTNQISFLSFGMRAHLLLNKKSDKSLLIYLCGPLSNLILALMFNEIPMVYEINIALCVINLVPISPLDGYNILKCLLTKCCKKQKNVLHIMNLIQIIATAIVFALGILLLVFSKRASLLLFTICIVTMKISGIEKEK